MYMYTHMHTHLYIHVRVDSVGSGELRELCWLHGLFMLYVPFYFMFFLEQKTPLQV